MIDRLASSIDTADSRTRVHAFTVLAGAIRGTIRADCTLRPAQGWSSNKRGRARANSLSVGHATLAVQTTGRWTAGISWFC